MASPSEEKRLKAQIDDLNQQVEAQKQIVKGLEVQLYERAKYSEMVQGSNSIITKFDSNFNFLYINPYAQTFFGFSESELIGKNAVGTIIPFQASTGRNLRTMIAKMLKNPDDFVDNENENVCKNGERVYVAWRNKVLRDEKGNFSGLLCFGYDITDLKNHEIKLNKAKKEAEAATVAKSDFLANMSHEIRTPMNGVIGMIEMLLDTPLNPEQKDYADSAIGSANSLLMLINDILDFSKIEAGKLDIETIDFDLRVTLEDLSEIISIKAEQKELRFHLFIDNDVPTKVKGDPGRLRQILVNLSGNAVKFTEKGDVSIGVHKEQETDSEITLRFEVTDTGIGIPNDKAKKLFQSFTQADTTISRKYGGTGLGLSISKKLTKLMGGKIGLNSNEGEGTTFWFTIKLEKQGKDAPESYNLKELSNHRILIADNSKMSCQVFTEYLTSWGCKPEIVRSGQQALSILEIEAKNGAPFDLLILEKQLPDIDAIKLAEQIYQKQTLERLISIIVTAYGKRGDVNNLKQAGFCGFLTKPLRKQDLYDMLSIVLSPDIKAKSPADRPFTTRYTIEEFRQQQVVTVTEQTPEKPETEAKEVLHVLLVEDNIMNQKVASKMLEKLGYQITVANHGGEAVSIFQNGKFDFILMDMQMPVMNGIEATIEIRKSEPPGSHIPIIACTANVMKGDKEDCIAAGMDGYIPKPIKKSDLQDIITEFTS